jgi:hypothetical protein
MGISNSNLGSLFLINFIPVEVGVTEFEMETIGNIE